MKLARLQTPEGVIQGHYQDGVVISGDDEYMVGQEGELLSPCSPTALYCVGRNFAETLDQMDYDRPEEPDFLIKPPTSSVALGQAIHYPPWTNELTYAGELVAIIDTQCHDVSRENVQDVIRGHTIMNDIDALDQAGRTARKAFDSSAPLGPWIETDLDPHAISMETTINGKTRQESNTELMLFKPYEIISSLSHRFTFSPGDAVTFGSPANPGRIEPGDDIEITYEGVRTLQNSVIGADP